MIFTLVNIFSNQFTVLAGGECPVETPCGPDPVPIGCPDVLEIGLTLKLQVDSCPPDTYIQVKILGIVIATYPVQVGVTLSLGVVALGIDIEVYTSGSTGDFIGKLICL